jgi:uncharacterized protein
MISPGISHHEPEIKRKDVLTAIALLAAVVLTAVHRQACGVDALEALGWFESEHARTWAYHICTALLFGFIPLGLALAVWKKPLSSFGVALGDWKFGLAAVLILLPVISAVLLLSTASLKEMQAVYPVDHTASESLGHFLSYAAGRVLLFYVAWEFFFRGFLLFGLRDTLGDTAALMIQVLPSALWHIGYPAGELYASIGAGVLFGRLALRTGSILWPLILHAGIGMVTDISLSLAK